MYHRFEISEFNEPNALSIHRTKCWTKPRHTTAHHTKMNAKHDKRNDTALDLPISLNINSVRSMFLKSIFACHNLCGSKSHRVHRSAKLISYSAFSVLQKWKFHHRSPVGFNAYESAMEIRIHRATEAVATIAVMVAVVTTTTVKHFVMQNKRMTLFHKPKHTNTHILFMRLNLLKKKIEAKSIEKVGG